MRINRYQRGQSLVLAIAALLICSAGVFFLFNTSQLATAKMRLENTSDAAIYSMGTYHARVLNFHAYTNRTMVAEQVAIAQVVSMASWLSYAKVATTNLATITSWVPYLNAVTNAIKTGVSVFESSHRMLAAGQITLSNANIQGTLRLAQIQMHAEVMTNGPNLLDKVIQRNYSMPNDVTPVAHEMIGPYKAPRWLGFGYYNFVKSYSADNRVQQVDMDARDSFSSQRDWDVDLTWFFQVANPAYWGFPYRHVDIALRKRGGTDLRGLEAWKGVDTLSLHISFQEWKCRVSWRGVRCGWDSTHIEVPLGWGGAYVSSDGSDHGLGYHGGSPGTNPSATSLAESVKQKLSGYYSGVQDYFDLRDISSVDSRDPKLHLALLLHQPAGGARTAGEIGASGGRMNLTENYANGGLAALSSADVFFKRPDWDASFRRKDGRTEYGSLFNPYWQTHLVPPSAAERAGSLGLTNAGLMAIF